MHKYSGTAAALAALLWVGTVQAAEVRVELGSSERVARLFAYPNNCSVICYRDWTLEQTAEHYLGQSLQRDGYADATVKVSRDGDNLSASFSGVPNDYGAPLTSVLNAGDLAFDGASKLNGDGKWQYSWYFFLPLGMALDNRKSVELLHFPPDYSLTQAQDYLESKTTDRWAALLSENGVLAGDVAADQVDEEQVVLRAARDDPVAALDDRHRSLAVTDNTDTVYGPYTVEANQITSQKEGKAIVIENTKIQTVKVVKVDSKTNGSISGEAMKAVPGAAGEASSATRDTLLYLTSSTSTRICLISIFSTLTSPISVVSHTNHP